MWSACVCELSAKTMKPPVHLCTFRCNYYKKHEFMKNGFFGVTCANAQLTCAH